MKQDLFAMMLAAGAGCDKSEVSVGATVLRYGRTIEDVFAFGHPTDRSL
jgi:hypothetical protein